MFREVHKCEPINELSESSNQNWGNAESFRMENKSIFELDKSRREQYHSQEYSELPKAKSKLQLKISKLI